MRVHDSYICAVSHTIKHAVATRVPKAILRGSMSILLCANDCTAP